MWKSLQKSLVGRKEATDSERATDPHRYPCLARMRGTCSDWDHCANCGSLEQSLRAIRPHERMW